MSFFSVLVDFCKLTLDYFNNGVNNEKYSLAAGKLNVSPSVIQNLVHALSCLILEGSRHNVEVSDALYLLQAKDPSYQDFTWRFEVQIASRSHSEQVKPVVVMDFILRRPKHFGQNNEDLKKSFAEDTNESKCVSSWVTNVPIQNAKAASQCQHTISHILLQCDLPNLLHLTNKLDLALKESKTQHVRKVQRALQ
ncbi:hypothetical protein MSG28_000380 [Choristoneura fumiferana]|uniref:Uncharacterized protein n=1 Tax=Choristoneura fumiferana TaxID=7141 RepID=A0ACC0K0T4_CHOFU|nr:hypothetical protein MSG28_000380 [Choristoneura fumiferana]